MTGKALVPTRPIITHPKCKITILIDVVDMCNGWNVWLNGTTSMHMSVLRFVVDECGFQLISKKPIIKITSVKNLKKVKLKKKHLLCPSWSVFIKSV